VRRRWRWWPADRRLSRGGSASERIAVENPAQGEKLDEAKARAHIQAHADAVVRGDMEAVIADFSEQLRPQVPQLAQALPQPVKSAEVLSVEVGEEESVALIRYAGDGPEVTIRSHWREVDGRPTIVHGAPVDD
jgi:hypothetical protein